MKRPEKSRGWTSGSANVELALSALAAVVAITCASMGQSEGGTAPIAAALPPTAASATAPATAGPAPTSGAPLAPPSPVAAAASTPAATAPSPELARFRAALSALARGERERVAVLWLGDSHTYADFWPHAVRSELARRFGDRGPGFLHLGVKPHRHDRARVEVAGKWRREPKSPSAGVRQDDGVFGLGGMRAVPVSTDAKVAVSPKPAGTEPYDLTLMFRATAGQSLELRVGSETIPIRSDSGRQTPGSPLRRFTRRLESPGAFELAFLAGEPQVFGAVLERRVPGIVVDSLGINGARAQTPLNWNESAWVAEVRERNPDLAIFAYGTNEAVSALTTDAYRRHFASLLARVRAAKAEVDCVIVGPTDMATAEGGSRPRVAEFDHAAKQAASELGCAYFSAAGAMGGEGSFARWMKESPPLAAADRIHLKPAGYERLGARLTRMLLGE